MFLLPKTQFVILNAALLTFFWIPTAFATETYNNKKTTTVEQTTTQTTSTAPRPVKKVAPVTPVATTTSNTTTVTTQEGEVRKVLDEDALKKMSDSLCVKGFKPYVGNDSKNVCQSRAVSPDIAYSCVWSENGNAAYAQTVQGPCSLEDAEHQNSVVVDKAHYASNPPLSYGTDVHCCFRAAKGPSTSTVQTSPTTTVMSK